VADQESTDAMRTAASLVAAALDDEDDRRAGDVVVIMNALTWREATAALLTLANWYALAFRELCSDEDAGVLIDPLAIMRELLLDLA
jgi:hypothetical protein